MIGRFRWVRIEVLEAFGRCSRGFVELEYLLGGKRVIDKQALVKTWSFITALLLQFPRKTKISISKPRQYPQVSLLQAMAVWSILKWFDLFVRR